MGSVLPALARFALRLSVTRILILMALGQQPAVAGAVIYRWVDDNGRVHFGDRPTGDSAERITIDKAPPADEDLKKRRSHRDRLLDVYSEERAEKNVQRQEAAARKAERQQQCAQAIDALRHARNAHFLYEDTDDPRNPRIFSDDERAAYLTRAEQRAAALCQ